MEQDILRAFDAMETVYHANGKIVPGLCDRNGLRYSSRGTGQRGGPRVKGEEITELMWLEPTVVTVFNNCKELLKSKYIEAVENDSDSDS